MENKMQDQFIRLSDSVIAFLPNLLGGLLLLLLGWLAAWIVKRILVQVSAILRVDRFISRSRWESDFSKADVRYGLYNFIGNIGAVIIFLIFLDNAMLAWKLTLFSDLLSKGILYLPKIIIAVVIFGAGWMISVWIQAAVIKTMRREDIPRASLISRFIKAIMIVFFSAIALVELNVAREIVIIGFATIFVTLGIIAVVISIKAGNSLIEKIENTISED